MEFNPNNNNENNSPLKRLKLFNNVIDLSQKPRAKPMLIEDVIDHIITFLPVKNAMQLSVLSKRFERTWQRSQNLCFDFWPSLELTQTDIEEIVNRVFLLHENDKIKEFRLCISPCAIEDSIFRWFNVAIEKKPEIIELDFLMAKFNIAPFEIPFENIDFDFVKSLTLIYCRIILPPKFKKLHFLRNLELRHIRLTHYFIRTIIQNCLFLESIDIARCSNVIYLTIETPGLKNFKSLRVGDCKKLHSLHVNSPTLVSFLFIGKPRNITFRKTMPKLNEVMINFKYVSSIFPRLSMMNLMRKISYVRVLTISTTVIEDLCSTFVHGRQAPKLYLWHLKELQIIMEDASFCCPFDVVKFIEKCPYLERLFIEFDKLTFEENNTYWDMHYKDEFEAWNYQYAFLRCIKFTSFKIKKRELQLVKNLLKNSPNLGTLALFTVKNHRTPNYLSAVTRVTEKLLKWRLSPNARVGIYEYDDKDNDVVSQVHKNYECWYTSPV